MSRSSHDTGHFCDSRLRVGHISARSCPSGCPCRLASSPKSRRQLLCTQGPDAQAPQPAGPLGQLGKEQTCANAEDLFSQHGVRFGQPNSTLHPGKCSVCAELPHNFIRQDGSPTETLSEAPGAYGYSCGDSSARLLHMRSLQHWFHSRIPRWAWKRGTHRVQITTA